MAKKVKERIVLREIHLRTTIIGVWRQWAPPPKKNCRICKHVEQVVLCCGSCWGNLQPSPKPLARFKWAARRGGEANAKREGGKKKERKGKEGIRKGEVALAPRKKNSWGHPRFNLLLNWFIDEKLLIEMSSSYRISLRLYLIVILQIFLTQSEKFF